MSLYLFYVINTFPKSRDFGSELENTAKGTRTVSDMQNYESDKFYILFENLREKTLKHH